MQKKPTAITQETVDHMAQQMSQYIQHQSIQYDTPIHYMEDGKLIEQSPTGVKQKIPLTMPHSQTA